MRISAAEFRPVLLMHQVHKAPLLAASLCFSLLSLKTAVVKLTDNPDANLLRWLYTQMREISIYARQCQLESPDNVPRHRKWVVCGKPTGYAYEFVAFSFVAAVWKT